jgi:uncharacterized protein (DUF1800 family)
MVERIVRRRFHRVRKLGWAPELCPIDQALNGRGLLFLRILFRSSVQKEFCREGVEWSMSNEPVIAVNRFGLGAAPGEIAAAADARGWLTKQIGGAAPPIPDLDTLAGSGERLRAYPRWIASLGRARGAMSDGAQAAPRTVEQTFREQLGPMMQEEIAARLTVATSTPAPFRERLVWFWSNHFTVSAEKALVFALAGSFEREAIRPHVCGRFADMLLAATRHPAMILYLDNHLSVRQGWRPRGLRASRSTAFPAPRGLNENLAREILELHTLGVNGGYTQADVTEFARVLTGWTARPTMFDLDETSPGFAFDPARHEPGARHLLGNSYPQDGIAQGEAVLRDIAVHPATATFIAFKLARHFIADQPPPAAVDRIARAFRDSGGHLPTVYEALLGCAEAWQQPLAKLKSPIEYVVSCLRALPGLRSASPRGLYGTLRGMGQRPFFAPSPQGWPDTAAAWSGGDSLWKRIEWAGTIAARIGSRVDPLRLAAESYGPALAEPTRREIARAESRQQGIALWLASPESQRR